MSYEGLKELLEEQGHTTALTLLEKVENGELNAVFKGQNGFTGDCSLDEQIEAFMTEHGASIVDCDIDVDESQKKI